MERFSQMKTQSPKRKAVLPNHIKTLLIGGRKHIWKKNSPLNNYKTLLVGHKEFPRIKSIPLYEENHNFCGTLKMKKEESIPTKSLINTLSRRKDVHLGIILPT